MVLRKLMSTGLYAAASPDPAVLRKLKPSLVAARVRSRAPKPAGTSPWVVLGVAFAAGYVVGKTIDWRGHAHPRR